VAHDLDEGRSLELRQYLAVIRRRWYVVVAGLMAGVLGGFGFLHVANKSVTATATVNINVFSSTPFDNQKPPSQLFDATTEQALATSAEVLGRAATELGNGQTPTQMRSRTAVLPVAGATIVKVSFTASSKSKAYAGADAIANDYLDYRSSVASTKVKASLDKFTSQRNRLSQQLKVATGHFDNATPNSPQATQADAERQLVDLELTGVVNSINEFDSIDTSGGSLISSADANPVKLNPSSKLVYAGGALLGLIFGLLLAFLVNVLDRRIPDGESLTGIGGGAVLSELTSRRAAVPAVGDDLDQIRSLRERLLATVEPGGNLVVMDLVVRDRPSDIAMNLALSMVERGDPVQLVLPDYTDAHLRLLVRVLDLEKSGSSTDASRYVSRLSPGLAVIATHEDQALGAPGARLGNILTTAHQPGLTTIVAMPPTAPRSLWLTAGRLGHSIILVAARRETRTRAVRQLVEELQAVGAVIHGSVLVPRRRSVDMKPAKRSSRKGAPEQQTRITVTKVPAKAGPAALRDADRYVEDEYEEEPELEYDREDLDDLRAGSATAAAQVVSASESRTDSARS
jgi:capsular polysaccharide biosynthesis protein